MKRTNAMKPTWTPPGPGSWVCERSHGSPGFTPLYRRIVSEHTAPTYRQVFADYGGAVDTLDMQFVNGACYRRLVPLVGAAKDTGKVPPKPVLWLATRLHPEFRRREKQARSTMENRSFLDDIRAWNQRERGQWRAENLALQAIDPASLDDAALAQHLGHLDQHLVKGWRRHHQLHGSDLGPIGDLLAHAKQWGLDLTAVMGLLRGASPATVDAARHGTKMAEALRAGGVDPEAVSSVEEIRSVPAAGAALVDYLDEFGWRLISNYDFEGLTLNEVPAAVFAIIRRAAVANASEPTNDGAHHTRVAEIRSQVSDPALFEELLDSARQAYGVRDDNGPLTWEWPAGLTRRAYLEAGSRLGANGRLLDASHVFELDIPELAALLAGAASPTADELADRASHRDWEATLEAPDLLGPTPAEPDLSPLPPGIRRTMGLILTAVTMLDPDPAQADTVLSGLGIGTKPYTGRAQVADDANRAIQDMKPGDVLVAPWTAPSYNAVLSIAGGVVVQEGGLLCHAAVMARELDIPAVVGCTGAMSEIHTGDLVEIDPVAGVVRIVSPA